MAQLEVALQRRRITGSAVSVLYLDVDRFKGVNDRLGHAAGDEVLAAVARRLREAIRSTNVVGRLGGDEFAILLEGDDETATYAVAARVQALLTAPVKAEGGLFGVTASIGIATARDDECPDELVRHADLAMYEAKADGGAAHVLYAPQLDTELKERMALEADLRTALGNDELCLYYQPIIELATGLVSGMEALVRWDHPARGLLLPGAFLPVAEAANVMEPLERWVIQTAIRQASAWQRAGVLRRPLTLNINVSARHLVQPGFLRTFAADLTGSGLGSGLIALELTETDLVRDATHLSHTLAALRRAGVRVVIDDFGTAYASLSYLSDFPVDGIKIDRAFVATLDGIAGPRVNLARVMVDLARDFGIAAIAEGVETTEQAQALVAIGCRYAQGFLFGRPMPAADAAGLLAVGRAAPVPAMPAVATRIANPQAVLERLSAMHAGPSLEAPDL
jgi:diguanylate cyclase (GGDEF)-like protein